MIIFYVRCSTAEQNEARQLEDARLHKADRVFIDKASGKNKDRPQLAAMLAFAREGDTVVCSDISRIARNTRDLLFIVDELQKKNVAIYEPQGIHRYHHAAGTVYVDGFRRSGPARARLHPAARRRRHADRKAGRTP